MNAVIESLEKRSLFAITIPGTDIKIPSIPGIDIPIDLPGSDTPVVDVVNANRKRYGVPGLVAATMKNGKIDEIGAAGVRLAGQSDRVRWGDPMLIASGTKAMTATLVARLVERGYMKWTHKVVDVFPGFAGRSEKYLNATLEQLLSHRSGMPTDLSVDLTIATAIAPGDPMTIRSNYLPRILRQTPAAKAGDYHYSNVGYIVASTMIEQAMREPYENMMRRLVFEPLGMTSAGFGWPGSSDTLNAPRPHSATGSSPRPDSLFRFPAIYNASGGVHVNIIDWAKFVGVQLGQAPKRFLSPATIDKLSAPIGSYALGWNTYKQNGFNVIQHDGTDGYWYSSVIASRDQKTAILVMGNRGGLAGERAVHDTLVQLQGRLIDL
jgi:CubicO group peptidase (beta-lactamase class C family)